MLKHIHDSNARDTHSNCEWSKLEFVGPSVSLFMFIGAWVNAYVCPGQILGPPHGSTFNAIPAGLTSCKSKTNWESIWNSDPKRRSNKPTCQSNAWKVAVWTCAIGPVSYLSQGWKTSWQTSFCISSYWVLLYSHTFSLIKVENKLEKIN